MRKKDVPEVGRCFDCGISSDAWDRLNVSISDPLVSRIDEMKNQRHACPQAGPFPQGGFQPVGNIGHCSDSLGQFQDCQPVLVCFGVQHDAAVCAGVHGSQDGK